MPHFRVPLIFPSQENKMASLKDIIWEALASMNAKFDGTDLVVDELNNTIGEVKYLYFIKMI